MANSGFLGLSLLAYASWQTLSFLKDRGTKVWAKSRYHRYVPRPTNVSQRKKISCSNCVHFKSHMDFLHSGMCDHPDWKTVMRSTEVMVRRDGHCELWERSVIPR